jgi:hypothetical protein
LSTFKKAKKWQNRQTILFLTKSFIKAKFDVKNAKWQPCQNHSRIRGGVFLGVGHKGEFMLKNTEIKS